MEISTFPTKSNMIKAKATLDLSRQGYELLDKKRSILIRELMSLIDRANKLQRLINETYTEAYEALQTANITIGISEVEQLGFAVPEEDSINIRIRSIMGVEIPVVDMDESSFIPRFGFSRTNLALDIAYKRFDEVKHLTVELAEVENSIYRLATNIKRTQKRANALKNILIPRYETISKSIQNSLEEKDREEFTRLKLIKKKNE